MMQQSSSSEKRVLGGVRRGGWEGGGKRGLWEGGRSKLRDGFGESLSHPVVFLDEV